MTSSFRSFRIANALRPVHSPNRQCHRILKRHLTLLFHHDHIDRWTPIRFRKRKIKVERASAGVRESFANIGRLMTNRDRALGARFIHFRDSS